MKIKANYEEPCVCGYNLENVKTQNVWRFVTWTCPKCGEQIASTMRSDSPVSEFYVAKALFIRANNYLRKKKGLEPKKTIVTFYGDDGKRIFWKDIVSRNKAWEKKVGVVQRKPF